MANKTYDRAQVLQVAAQLLAGQEAWTPGLIRDCVSTARELIDEVERQCQPPEKPEATPCDCEPDAEPDEPGDARTHLRADVRKMRTPMGWAALSP